MYTIRQCPIELYSKVDVCSQESMSHTVDEYINFTFAFRLFRWKAADIVLVSLSLSRHCFSQVE